MLGIYCYFNSDPNVILPFYNVAVRIPEDNKTEIETTLEKAASLNISKLEYSLSKLKSLGIKHFCYEIGKFEVEKYGLESVYYKSVKALNNLDEEIIVANCNKLNDFTYKVIYKKDYAECLDLQVAYLFSKYYRNSTLNRLHKYYPNFQISKHKGSLTSDHLDILQQTKVLPDFYNESFLINHFLKQQQYPKWVQTYIKNHYEPIIK